MPNNNLIGMHDTQQLTSYNDSAYGFGGISTDLMYMCELPSGPIIYLQEGDGIFKKAENVFILDESSGIFVKCQSIFDNIGGSFIK